MSIVRKLQYFTLIVVLTNVTLAHAVEIQFPEESLARESVSPVFDNPSPVKRRNVSLESRLELGAYAGTTLNDALVDPITYGMTATYHFTELHALQLLGGLFSAENSQYVTAIEKKLPAAENDLSNIPKPRSLILGSYQLSPYYGKISLTKQSVLNLSIFMTLSAGTIALGDSNYFVYGFGFGQKLYFTKNFGLRLDLRAIFHRAPNPLSKAITPGTNPPNSYYVAHDVTNGLLTGGLIYIF